MVETMVFNGRGRVFMVFSEVLNFVMSLQVIILVFLKV